MHRQHPFLDAPLRAALQVHPDPVSLHEQHFGLPLTIGLLNQLFIKGIGQFACFKHILPSRLMSGDLSPNDPGQAFGGYTV